MGLLISFLKNDEIRPSISCQIRARNNGQSTDNVQNDWGVDRSTFRLAGHVDRSHLIILKMK